MIEKEEREKGKKKKFKRPFYPPRMNVKLHPNEKYKAFKIEKAEGSVNPDLLKKIPLVAYRNELFEMNFETKMVERIDKVAAWQDYTIRILPEESPTSATLSWIWDMKASEGLKEFYFQENRKMIYYFLNDVKKAAKYAHRAVTFNKESFERYKENKSGNPPNLVITLDKIQTKMRKDEEYNPDDTFINEIIDLFIETGLYDKEKEGKLIVAREVYFTK